MNNTSRVRKVLPAFLLQSRNVPTLRRSLGTITRVPEATGGHSPYPRSTYLDGPEDPFTSF